MRPCRVDWATIKSKYFMSGYVLYGSFTTKQSLPQLADYLVAGVQTNPHSSSTLAFLYRQQPAEKVAFAFTYRNMPLVTEKSVANIDSMSVLASVLSGEAQQNTCPEFSDSTAGCNGLGSVFGFAYKDATAKQEGSLQLWLWLPDPSSTKVTLQKGDSIGAFLAEYHQDDANPAMS